MAIWLWKPVSASPPASRTARIAASTRPERPGPVGTVMGEPPAWLRGTLTVTQSKTGVPPELDQALGAWGEELPVERGERILPGGVHRLTLETTENDRPRLLFAHVHPGQKPAQRTGRLRSVLLVEGTQPSRRSLRQRPRLALSFDRLSQRGHYCNVTRIGMSSLPVQGCRALPITAPIARPRSRTLMACPGTVEVVSRSPTLIGSAVPSTRQK